MITLVADDTPLLILSAVTEPVQLVDKNGTVVEQFIPDQERIKRLYESSAPPLDPAEIERRLNEPGPRHTTREVFEHLLTLADNPEDQADLREHIAQLAKREGRAGR
jgi:hypothetical protein